MKCQFKFNATHYYKLYVVMFLLIIMAQPALCDDALLKVYGGSLKLHDGELTTIRMESEAVRIDLHDNTYTVDATFVFYNYGATTTVKVGFPKTGHGYAPGFRSVANFASFQTWVNGSRVSVKEYPGDLLLNGQKMDEGQILAIRKGTAAGWMEETRWLVKGVTFKRKAKTTTRVKYVAPYDVRRDEKYGEYLYGTGRSWSQSIGSARFIINVSPGLKLHWIQFCEGGKYQNIRKYEYKSLGQYEHEYVLRDIEPKDNENLKFLISSEK